MRVTRPRIGAGTTFSRVTSRLKQVLSEPQCRERFRRRDYQRRRSYYSIRTATVFHRAQFRRRDNVFVQNSSTVSENGTFDGGGILNHGRRASRSPYRGSRYLRRRTSPRSRDGGRILHDHCRAAEIADSPGPEIGAVEGHGGGVDGESAAVDNPSAEIARDIPAHCRGFLHRDVTRENVDSSTFILRRVLGHDRGPPNDKRPAVVNSSTVTVSTCRVAADDARDEGETAVVDNTAPIAGGTEAHWIGHPCSACDCEVREVSR